MTNLLLLFYSEYMSLNSSQGYNLDNFEANFREFLITEKVSPATIKNYLSDLRHFLGWYFLYRSSRSSYIIPAHSNNPVDVLSSLDNEAVCAYKTYLQSNNLPEKTINRRLSTVRKFCTLCISQGWLKENPAKGLANVGSRPHHHGAASFQTEIEKEHQDVPEAQVIFSAKQLYEFQKSLSALPIAESQTIQKDIEEFFVIINSTKFV